MIISASTGHSSTPKFACDKQKNSFTLIELLVVIAVIGILAALLLSAISQARERAMITLTNMDLAYVGLAINMYYEDNKKFPPTQDDCGLGTLTAHLYQLPRVLTNGYLPSPQNSRKVAMSTVLQDRFHPGGYTYKYKSVGDIILSANTIAKWQKAQLWVPTNFPTSSNIDTNSQWYTKGQWYTDISTSPVSWVVFSLGPRYSDEWLTEKLGNYPDNNYNSSYNRYPVPKELWYTPRERRGFIVRMQLQNGTEIGSF